MAKFVLPAPRDYLKFHTRWNERSLAPYAEELTELWAQNKVHAVLEESIQGPMMLRFAVLPSDMASAGRIIKLTPTYRAIFRRRDLKVYRSQGRILIDIPWQQDTVCLGDLLNTPEYLESPGLPLGIGMNLQRESVLDDLTDIPHLLVTGTQSGWVSEFLEGLLVSALLKVTPEEVQFTLFSSPSLSFSLYDNLPYCDVITSQRQMLTFLSDLEDEIDRRYTLFLGTDCHNIYDYNEAGGILSHHLILIPEYSLLLNAGRRSAERSLRKILELGGNCGLHLITASLHPEALIPLKDLFPARVVMKVDSASDSIRLLDQKGAEELRKHGLYYLDGHNPLPVLLEGGALTSRESRDVVDALLKNYVNGRRPTIFDEIEEAGESTSAETGESTPDRNASERNTRKGFWAKLFS